MSEPENAGAGSATAVAAEFDLVVLGAGVGGLTAALVAAIEGRRVLVIEKSRFVGGTSARSSGTVWIPDNPYMRRQGMTDDAAAARQYLDALAGERIIPELRDAFLAAGPEMVEYLEARTDIRFKPYPAQPDYRQELPGVGQGWRPLEPVAFDGRTLGRHFDDVGWPLPELVLFRGMMVTRSEVARLLKLGKNLDSLLLGARLVLRYAWDRLRHKRGTRLVLGNALVARLYGNLLERGGTVWLGCGATRLLREDGQVRGLMVHREGREVRVGARLGVVMAGGGFPASPELRERYLPSPTAQYTAAFEGCVGETIQLAEQVGGVLGPMGEDNALWFPSSIAKRADGSTAVYPHIVLDRAKPGLIAVNQAGRRFVDEGVSYHEFTRAMYRENRRTPCIPAMLVCDRRFVWKYGLGMIRPRTPFLRHYIASGYLTVADTLEDLARKIGVDPAGLAETARTHNRYAQTGVDEDFGKGSNSYDRSSGDPTVQPNPCLGPIERPPFCAVAVVPTPLGTSLGLLTNGSAQVLDAEGRPIPGLYACGNDMHSAFGGEYPGAGSQLGSAMAFGYLAARHAGQGV
ncbi:MAG TPA: FAD-dependent oxidoreductase [bacterium]|nr:FAD-dependent oxidoreductase [bacterium]